MSEVGVRDFEWLLLLRASFNLVVSMNTEYRTRYQNRFHYKLTGSSEPNATRLACNQQQSLLHLQMGHWVQYIAYCVEGQHNSKWKQLIEFLHKSETTFSTPQLGRIKCCKNGRREVWKFAMCSTLETFGY